jgi:O-acetyl-ADP-ribose deacetylase (regulator of RNase III)
MVTLINGDIFSSNAQTIVNTVNCVGVMGKGIALEYKKRYPDMFLKYKEICNKKQLDIGKLWLYKGPDKWVLNFPTKKDWRNPSEVEYLILGLDKFVKTYKEKGITSIAFPLLGANNGGLSKDTSLAIMKQYLNKCDIDVYICDNRL